MIRCYLVALSLLPLSAPAQTQVPNVFEDGTPATAAEVNENFQYVLENASGGCSVEQVGNTAEITCADGTTAVVPGYGTVVVYPEGGITGDSPAVSWPTGEIVYVDADGVTLAAAKNDAAGRPYALLNQYYVSLYNDGVSNSVVVTGYNNGLRVWYLSDDCTGQAFGLDAYAVSIEGQLSVPDLAADATTLLTKSYKQSGYGMGNTLADSGSCIVISAQAGQLRPLVEYTPAPEILNAAYPVRLEQLP